MGIMDDTIHSSIKKEEDINEKTTIHFIVHLRAIIRSMRDYTISRRFLGSNAYTKTAGFQSE